MISITITGIVAKLILAAFRVTEVIQFSLNVSKKPVYLLTVDAMSAYDRCLRQILSSQQYKADITGSALTFMNNRLASRATTYQWEGAMMGPARDDTGFEQGGIIIIIIKTLSK